MRSSSTFVYLLKADNGLVKIGIASDVNSRAAAVNGASPITVKILCAYKIDEAKRVETHLHAKYKNKRTKHEWFSLSDKDVLSVISTLSSNGTKWEGDSSLNRAVSFRFSDAIKVLLRQSAIETDNSETGILEKAIRELAAKHNIK